MSKKDLLERLNRSPDGRVLPRPEVAAARTRDDAVTTRVSKKVVRRRRRDRPAEEPPALEAAPVAPVAPVEAAAPVVAAEPAAAPAEVVAPMAAAPQQAPTPVAEPVAVGAAPVAATSEAAPAEAAAKAPEAAVQTVAEVAKAEGTPAEAPAVSAVSAVAPVAPVAQATPVVPAVPAPPAPKVLPERAQFTGLGKAVVMPPPGYDPTNPHAWRREQAQAAAQPAATPAKARGRRRVATTAAPGRNDRSPAGRRRPNRGRGGPSAFDRMRRKPRRKRSSGPKAASPAPKGLKRKVRVNNEISVRDLAMQLQVKAGTIIKTLMELGIMSNITEMLDMDTATLVAAEFDYEADNVGFQEDTFLQHVETEIEADGQAVRPPVVTIMGHVDHGKTTLLDAIRSSRIAVGEAGGITQHIGAYQVPVGDSTITFLDTPGHAAFSAMRARGAGITDIVVLVVAADDGVQPQTAEAISHAKAAGVPIIVAVNKIDKPGVNPEQVKQQLTEFELIPEEWGGDTLFVHVSALRGDGLEDLIEAIHLQAEVLDLQANPDRHAEGVVIEAQMVRGRGAVATVLVQQGTLKASDYVVLGSAFGRVRAMLDHKGKKVKQAGPSTPVELFGLSELPEVGDALAVVKSEKNARKLAEHRGVQKRLASSSGNQRGTAEEMFAAAARAANEKLHVVLKADVQGTLQAIKSSIESIEIEGTEINLLLAAVGDISESDVNLASSDDAILLGFNVRIDPKARRLADEKGVTAQMYKVIYGLLEAVEARMRGLLAPEFELVLNGTAEIRQLFRISKLGTIAGSYVTDGVIGRNDQAKVVRGGDVVWEGTISQLKRFKDDVREVRSGYECGISLTDFNDLEEGDVIQAFRLEEVPPNA